MKNKPTGFVAICQCGKVVGAMDYDRTGRKEAGKILGYWLANGCNIVSKFGSFWNEKIESCVCDKEPT
jgi:hypothetical protein